MSDEPQIDGVVATYLKLRRSKEAIQRDVKDQVEVINTKLGKLEAWLQEKADELNVKSFKTEAGTAFLTTSDYASVADWDAVLEFIKANDAYDLLNKAVNKKAVREYIDADKAVPQGINFGTRVSIAVRSPAKKD